LHITIDALTQDSMSFARKQWRELLAIRKKCTTNISGQKEYYSLVIKEFLIRYIYQQLKKSGKEILDKITPCARIGIVTAIGPRGSKGKRNWIE
jgi:hypothetical protein